jgi:hypothetical protein
MKTLMMFSFLFLASSTLLPEEAMAACGGGGGGGHSAQVGNGGCANGRCGRPSQGGGRQCRRRMPVSACRGGRCFR